MMEIIRVFITLMFLHALADFSFQSDAMAKGKNRLTQKRIFDNLPQIVIKEDPKEWSVEKIEAYEKKWNCILDINETNHVEFRKKYRLLPNGQKFINCWFYWMSAHAMIHGGLIIMVFPEFWFLGLIEMVTHFFTDVGKCEQRYNVHTDQLFHLLFKLCYLWIMVI